MPQMIMPSNSVFQNGNSMFVEYIDIIKTPYAVLLLLLKYQAQRYGDTNAGYLDLSEIVDLDDEELGDWYVGRKYQNLFANLIKEDYRLNKKEWDDILNQQIVECPQCLEQSSLLHFGYVLKQLLALDNFICHKLYIWYPYDNKAVKEDIKETFSDIERYMEILTGPIEEALKQVPNDSTYVFSDITKIGILEDLGKLDYNSIIIPEEYGYNAEDGEWIMDLDAIKENHCVKIDMFYATEEVVDEEETEYYESSEFTGE